MSDPEEARRIDAALLALLHAGDRAGAATLALRGHGPRVLGFLWMVLRDDEAAQEVYAQFCEDLWKGITGYRGEAQFRTWMYQLAYNAARRHGRDPFRRRGRAFAPHELTDLIAEHTRAPTAAFRRTSLKNGVMQLREHLTPEDQTLLALRIDQRMDWREIATVLAEEDGVIEPATLRKRYERLKKRLRELATAQGLLGPGK